MMMLSASMSAITSASSPKIGPETQPTTNTKTQTKRKNPAQKEGNGVIHMMYVAQIKSFVSHPPSLEKEWGFYIRKVVHH